jgi:hypothetical protein
MQTKTGAFLSTGRIPQYIGQAALAASVFAGGASLLNAGGAMAVSCPTAGTFDSPNAGDFKSSCPLLPGGDISTLAVDYDPGLITGAGSYNYNVATISPPGKHFFDNVDLGVDVNAIGTYSVSVTKDVYTALGGTLLGSITFTQTGAGSSKTPELDLWPTYELKNLYIVDSYTVTGDNAAIDKITNTYNSVPGPLPILGAGAAFGFSRKLRNRIKAARTA